MQTCLRNHCQRCTRSLKRCSHHLGKLSQTFISYISHHLSGLSWHQHITALARQRNSKNRSMEKHTQFKRTVAIETAGIQLRPGRLLYAPPEKSHRNKNSLKIISTCIGCDLKSLIHKGPVFAHKKKNLSGIFRGLHVDLSRTPCWAAIPLMKVHLPPDQSHQIITDNFLIALQPCS